ncbi:MAG: cytochrome P450 [Solirubrobacterales bacterium]
MARRRTDLPPTPPLPAVVQTALWVFRPIQFMHWMRAHYGDTYRVKLLAAGDVVATANPQEIRKVFTAKADQLHAGEANIVLAPIVGDNSVLVLDEQRHLRQRRLLLPPFHGDRMRAYEVAMREITQAAITRWPRGKAFRLRDESQAITMDVILRVVFGITDPDRTREFRDRMNAIEPQRWFKRFALLPIASRIPALEQRLFAGFNRAKADFDALMLEEITARRAAPDAAEREDILSMLLQATDEDGNAMSDDELRDELVTLVVAGHETTATSLAWTFELMLRHPDVWRRVVDEARDPDASAEYVDAVVKESLRMRPILPLVARVIKQPWNVDGYELNPGRVVAPNIYLAHYREATWGDPEDFRPDRFIGQQPEGSVWLPFGGGIRRCIGASFALYEMRVVIQEIARELEVSAVRQSPEKIVRRAITFAPGNDVPIVVEDAAARSEALALDAAEAGVT